MNLLSIFNLLSKVMIERDEMAHGSFFLSLNKAPRKSFFSFEMNLEQLFIRSSGRLNADNKHGGV